MRKFWFVLFLVCMFTGTVVVAIADAYLGIMCGGITGMVAGIIAAEWKSL